MFWVKKIFREKTGLIDISFKEFCFKMCLEWEKLNFDAAHLNRIFKLPFQKITIFCLIFEDLFDFFKNFTLLLIFPQIYNRLLVFMRAMITQRIEHLPLPRRPLFELLLHFGADRTRPTHFGTRSFRRISVFSTFFYCC